MMNELLTQLQQHFSGEIDTSAPTLATYSHDASLFEVKPQAVVAPKTTADVGNLIKLVSQYKAKMPNLSLTARSAGTDMSGGAVNDSIIVDFLRHFTAIEQVTATSAQAQPGVYYRNFEPITLQHGALVPSYPASRELCTIGGMVNNNSGGEKSLEYGKTISYVTELKVVLADGNEYDVRPLNKAGLEQKMAQANFEGKLYRGVYELIEQHYDEIKAARPHVSKNSTGYNLWDVWDREHGIFDLTKLFVGAQGTLGFVTDIHFRLVPAKKFSGLLVVYMTDTKNLGEVINVVLKHKPTSFESFDEHTFNLSIKFFPYFRKTLGFWPWVKLALSLIPDTLKLVRGLPKLILLIEFEGDSQAAIHDQVERMRTDLHPYGFATIRADKPAQARKYWLMRRESFNLLRHKVKKLHTAPFIDDLVVPPQYLPEFLPQLQAILAKYKFLDTVAGHMGDGNFHVIPLMKLEDPAERAKLEPAMNEVFDLVLKYHGSLSGEHNDGLIRGPWLEKMYGPNVMADFRAVKKLFDPLDIFNPHKKADANWQYSHDHIRQSF